MVRAGLLSSLVVAGGAVAVIAASPAQAATCAAQHGRTIYQSMYVYDRIPASTTTMIDEIELRNGITECQYTGTEIKTSAYPNTAPVSQSRNCEFRVEWQGGAMTRFGFISCRAWR